MPIKKVFLTAALFFLALLVINVQPANASDMAITPASFLLNLKSGQSVEKSLTVQNFSSEKITVKLTPAADLEDQNFQNWLTINDGETELSPAAKHEFKFKVNVPNEASTALYRSVILVETAAAETSESAISNRLAAKVAINVLGNDSEGEKWLSAEPQLVIERVEYKKRWWPQPLSVEVTVTNVGPWSGKPHGIVRLTAKNSRHWQAVINESQQILLPGQTATFDLKIPANYQVGRLNSEGVIALNNEKPAFKGQQVTLFPWAAPLVIIFAVILAIIKRKWQTK